MDYIEINDSDEVPSPKKGDHVETGEEQSDDEPKTPKMPSKGRVSICISCLKYGSATDGSA